MKHYPGLHGVHLPTPPPSILADLMRHSPVEAATTPPAPKPLNPQTGRRTRRMLAIAARLNTRFDMPRMLAALTRETCTPKAAASTLARLTETGLIDRLPNTGTSGAWCITRAGRAEASAQLRDIATVPEAHVLDAVRLINATPIGNKKRWWPARAATRPADRPEPGGEPDGEPATSATVCDMLVSTNHKGSSARADIDARLHRMADQGLLIRDSHRRANRDIAVYWLAPKHHKPRKDTP